MRYFFVYAHPEPDLSFNGALLRHAIGGLEAAGHEVRVSDLYRMGFNPIASASDFAERRFPERLQYDREQKHAATSGSLPDDVKTELEKVFWCDILVLQFPLYWFSMPAILKGWIDRVFVNTIAYGKGKRYETGGFAGRRAMIACTTGGNENMFRPDGLLGDYRRALWHIHNGMLHYTGFSVVPPFMGWSPIFGDAYATQALFDRYRSQLLQAGTTEPLSFHCQSDFDADHVMKPDIVPVSDGHWRPVVGES